MPVQPASAANPLTRQYPPPVQRAHSNPIIVPLMLILSLIPTRSSFCTSHTHMQSLAQPLSLSPSVGYSQVTDGLRCAGCGVAINSAFASPDTHSEAVAFLRQVCGRLLCGLGHLLFIYLSCIFSLTLKHSSSTAGMANTAPRPCLFKLTQSHTPTLPHTPYHLYLLL